MWFFEGGLDQWKFTVLDYATGSQTFDGNDTGSMLESQIGFLGNGRALVEYFECGSLTPTRAKTITWSTL